MIKNRYITIITILLLIIGIFISLFYSKNNIVNAGSFEYADKLFNDDIVHNVDIQINKDSWRDLLDNAIKEEYYICDVEIDGVLFENVGIRAKGNTSLSQVYNSDSDRYSFKISFNEYNENNLCYGLDNLSLNNTMSDTTYMKDYISYDIMNFIGAKAPLSSFMNITVNGEPWGLYLGVETISTSFLRRNYGSDYGALYKPETMNMGDKEGRPQNGEMPFNNEKGFPEGMPEDMGDRPPMMNRENLEVGSEGQNNRPPMPEGGQIGPGEIPEKKVPNGDKEQQGFNKGFSRNQDNSANLKYIDDSIDSYSVIFDSAKTKITNSDKNRLINSLKVLSLGSNLDSVIDIENTLKYWVGHNFVCNYDSYTGNMLHNYYLYENKGIMTMLPWDYNLAFGGFSGMGGGMNSGSMDTATQMVNSLIDYPLQGASEEDRPFWGKLIENSKYKELYHQYFDEFISEYFESGYFEEKIDKMYELLLPYVENDATAFYSVDEYKKGVETLKEFCLLRSESIRKQLNNEKVDNNVENYVDASEINLSDLGTQHNNSKDFQNRNGKNLNDISDMPNILEVEDISDSKNKENMKDEFSMTK